MKKYLFILLSLIGFSSWGQSITILPDAFTLPTYVSPIQTLGNLYYSTNDNNIRYVKDLGGGLLANAKLLDETIFRMFSAVGVTGGAANAQSIPALTYTKVTVFNAEEFDTHNLFDANTFTVPTSPSGFENIGIYHFDLKLNLFAVSPPAGSIYTIQVRKNNSNVRISTHNIPSDALDYTCSFNLDLSEDDTIEIWVYGTISFKVYAAGFSSFSGYRLR
jgi:hypothetical protein